MSDFLMSNQNDYWSRKVEESKKANQNIQGNENTGILDQRVQEYKQKQQERNANIDRYGVEVPDEYYEIFNQIISKAETPEQAQEEAYRLGSAVKYSQAMNESFLDAYKNVDAYNAANFTNLKDQKSRYEALSDMLTLGRNNVKLGELGQKLMKAQRENDTELANAVMAEIDAINQQNVLMQDNTPRSWVMQALEAGAQSLPFTGAVAGAGIIGNFIAPVAGTGAAFAASSYLSAGQEYIDMLANGASPETARTVAMISGGIQGLIEADLGITKGIVKGTARIMGKEVAESAAKKGLEEIGRKVFKKFHFGSGKKLLVNYLENYGKNILGEGTEEFLQEITSIVGQEVAASLDGYDIPDDDFKHIVKQTTEAFRGGVLGALSMGFVPAGINGAADIKEYKLLKDNAEEFESPEMFKEAVKDSPVFEGMNESEKSDVINEVWQRAQARKEEAVEQEARKIAEVQDAAEGAEEAQVTEEGEEVAEPVARDEGGKLMFSDDENISEDGKVHGSFRAGDKSKKENNRYGYINYTADEDNKTVTIDDFKMTPGREGLRNEVFDEFARKYAGYDIQWNPTLSEAASIKENLVKNNPSGAKAGLSYYADENAVADASTRARVAAEIKKNIHDIVRFTNENGEVSYKRTELSNEQVSSAVALLEAAAKRTDMSLTEYVDKTFGNQIFGSKEEFENAASAQGDKISGKAGGVNPGVAQNGWKQFGQQVKAVIYAGENADFSTWAHELAHIFQAQLDGDLKAQAEKAFNVINEDWINSKYKFKDGHVDSAAEAFAYGFQDWLKTGKAESEEMKNIFQKFAEFIVRAYNSLKDFINLTPEITSVYEQLLKGDDSLLKAAEMAVKEQDNRYRAEMKRQAEEKENARKTEEENQKKQAEAEREEASETTDFEEEEKELTPEEAEKNLQEAENETEKTDNVIDDALENTNLTDEEKDELSEVLNDEFSTVVEKAEAMTEAASSVYDEDEAIPDDMFFMDEADVNEVNTQEDYIRKQYEGTAQWMKAPNGQPTKLTEKQWLQVRTTNFKRWFGNWELAKKVFNVVNTERATFNNKAAAMDWAEKNIIGLMNNEQTGGKGEINISNKSIDEMLNLNQRIKSSSNEVHYAALTKLREIIHDSEIVDAHPDYAKDKNGNRTPLAGINKDVNVDVLYGALSFEGEIYRVKTTIKRYVDENANSKAYAYDVQKIEVLPGIADNGNNTTVSKGNTSITGDILLQGVRKVNQKVGGDGELALEDYSKVLDENGEPLVVYHGSNQWFQVFNESKTNKSSNVNTPDNTIFTNDNKEIASSFENYYGGRVKDVILDKDSPLHRKYDWGTYRAGGVYSLFMNLRNPKILDYKGQTWKADGMNINEEVAKAMQEGYDGVIAKNIIDVGLTDVIPPVSNDYIAFNNTAVKSATDNNGNFDLSNPNILFQDEYNSENTNLTERQWLQVHTPAFKKWFKNSKVVDENNDPLVVYHGTYNGKFDVFDKNKANPENDFGKGFYFTSNDYDVSENYEGGGPDFENKVERLAERLQQDNEELSYEEAKQQAHDQLYVDDNLFKVYLSMQNPVYVGENETDIINDLFNDIEISEEDFESEDDYYEELDNAKSDKLEEIRQAILYTDYYGAEAAADKVMDFFYSNDSGTLAELKELLNDGSIEVYDESDENYSFATNEIVRVVAEALGYDGIIDTTVSEKFANMNLSEDTTHYIVFNSNQIKSATDNSGEFNPDNPSILFQDETDDIQQQINQLMTMEKAKDMIQRTFVLANIKDWYDGEYTNGDEWLKDRGVDEVAMYVDNEWQIQDKFLNDIPALIDGDFTSADIIEAYLNGTLTGPQQKKETLKPIDTSIDTGFTDNRFYAPQRIDADAKELLEKASVKVTDANKKEVYKARADFITAAHDVDFASRVGMSQSAINKKIMTWAAYPASAAKISNSINNKVALQNKWTGIENSNLLKLFSIDKKQLMSMVKDVTGNPSEYQLAYVTSVILALDTHIDFSGLTYEFNANIEKKTTAGQYNSSERKIQIKLNSLNTIAHETGHALDHLWGREILGHDDYLTMQVRMNVRRDTITDPDVKSFLQHFLDFLESIENVSDLHSEYTMDSKEVFARFVARFTEWTRNVATNNRFGFESKWYDDKFTTQQYYEFAKILQEKSALDTKKTQRILQNVNNNSGADVANLFFQTEAELADEARTFDDWQSFMEYCETMHAGDEVSPIPYNADAQWYQTFFETANGVETEQQKNEEKVTEKVKKEGSVPLAVDALFTTYIRSMPEMLDNFLKAVADIDAIDLDSEEWQQVEDEEGAKQRERIDQLKDFIDVTLSDYNWQTAIKRIQGGHEIAEGLRKRLIGEITDGFKVRDFRALYAEIMDDEQYAVDEEDTTVAQLNKKLSKYKKFDILRPNEDISRVSPERRKRIAEALQNREIAEKIRNGSLKLDDEIEAYLKSLDKQVKDLQKEYNDLEKETKNDYQRLADAERRKLLKLHEELLLASGKLKKRDAETERKIKKGLKITEKYRYAGQNLTANYDELFRKFTDLKNSMQITAEVQAALDRQEQVAGLKENLNNKQKEKNLIAEVKKMRIQLVKRTMRRVPFNRIDYNNAKTVIAIQRMLEPNLLGGVNRFIGIDSAYLRGVVSGIVTDSEYKEKILSYLRKQNKSSQAFVDFLKKVEDLKTIKDFDSWTAKERKYAIKHLPKENWVRDLNLQQLAKEREESIDLDIGMKEKPVQRVDPKTGRVMTDKEGNPIYETTFVLDASDDIKKLVKDAVGSDMYDLIIDKPFSEWTTEELERLAQRIDELYTEGRDLKAAKDEARRRENDAIRQRIENAIKETGITINDDDTPEEKERKLKKIDAILNKNSGLKGTEAGKESGIKSKLDRLIHGYADANVLRVARILDNQNEGENVRLLYRREDECFNNKTRSIIRRGETVKKVMADNKITEEGLAQVVKVSALGTEFTVDELLYFLAADKDYEVDEKKAARAGLDPLDMNDDYAATSRNAVMFGNMMSDNASQELKEEWAKLDKDMQDALQNDALTPEQRQLEAAGQLDKKPGTTRFINACHARWSTVLSVANNFINEHPEYKALMEAIEADYAEQYERMNEISIAEFNTPVHRVRAYVPLVRRESNGADNVAQVKEDLLAAYGGEAGKQWVNKGMTQRRVNISPLNQKPVQTGLFRTWGDSIERTEHFIAYASYVRQLNAVYKSRDASYTRRFIEARYGSPMLKYIDDYINEVANPNANKIREKGAEFLHILRGKTAPAYLGWKLSGIVKQGLTSPWPYMQFVNPAEYFAAATKCWTSGGKMYDAIKEKSAFMASRVMDPINELVDEMAENAKSKLDRGWSKFSKMGMQGLEWIDWTCVAPGWLACYEKEYNRLQNMSEARYQEKINELTEKNMYAEVGTSEYMSREQIESVAKQELMDDIETEAVRYADDCTRACQPSSRLTDLAPLFKNSSEAMKAFLQFQTSLNVIWQNIRYDIPYAVRQKQFWNIVGTVSGYVLAGIFMNSVMDGVRGDDDDDTQALRNLIFYSTTQFTDAIPMIGSDITNMMDQVITGKRGFASSGTDMTPSATKIMSALTKATNGDFKKAAGLTAEGIGLFLGAPVSGVKEINKLLGKPLSEGEIDIKKGVGDVYGLAGDIIGE